MEYRDFVFWLQGFMELSNPSTLNTREVEMIKEHLALVFGKEYMKGQPRYQRLPHYDEVNTCFSGWASGANAALKQPSAMGWTNTSLLNNNIPVNFTLNDDGAIEQIILNNNRKVC